MSANAGNVGATTHVTKHTTTLPDGRQSVKITTKTSYPDGRTQVQTREDIQAPIPQPRSQQSVVKREISNNPDGSQRVKTTTTTTHPDGQRSVSVKVETVRPPGGNNNDGAAAAPIAAAASSTSSAGQQSSSASSPAPPPAAGNEDAVAASAPPSAPEPLPPPIMAPPSAPSAPPPYRNDAGAVGAGSSIPAAPAAVAVPIPFDAADGGNGMMELVAAQAVPATASNYSLSSQVAAAAAAAARSSHSAPAAAGSRSSTSSGRNQPVQIPVSLPPGPLGATFRGNPGEFPKIASVTPNSPLWPESVGMVVASLLLPGNQAVSGKVGTSELVRFLRHHANEEGRVLVLETTPQAPPPPPPPPAPTTRPNQLSIPLPPGPVGATFRGNPGEFPRVASVSVDSPLFGQVRSADGNDDGVVGMVVASLLLPGNVAVSGMVGTSTLVRHLREHSGSEGRVLVLERPKDEQDAATTANSSAGAAAVGSSSHARGTAGQSSSSSGEHKDMSFGEYFCNKRCGWIAVAVVLAIIAIIVGAVSEKEVACDQLCYEDEDCCVLSDYFCGGTEEEPACYCSRPSGGWYCGEEEASSKMKVGYVVPLVFAIIGFIAVGAYLSCMACQDFKSYEEERGTN